MLHLEQGRNLQYQEYIAVSAISHVRIQSQKARVYRRGCFLRCSTDRNINIKDFKKVEKQSPQLSWGFCFFRYSFWSDRFKQAHFIRCVIDRKMNLIFNTDVGANTQKGGPGEPPYFLNSDSPENILNAVLRFTSNLVGISTYMNPYWLATTRANRLSFSVSEKLKGCRF